MTDPAATLDQLERLAVTQGLTHDQAERLLELRALVLAAPEEKQSSLRAPLEVIVFRVHKSRYALPSRSITQVLDLGKTAFVPDVPTFILGAIALRNQLLPLLDLSLLLQGDRLLPGPGSRVVVMIAPSRDQLAILADEVLGIDTIDRLALSPPPATLPAAVTSCLAGLTADGTSLLMPDEIFERARS